MFNAVFSQLLLRIQTNNPNNYATHSQGGIIFWILASSFFTNSTSPVQHLPNIDIHALPQKLLSSHTLPQISILPKSTNLSFRRFPTTEIVPGSRWEDDILFSSNINGGSHATTFSFHICYDDYSYHSADTIQSHIQTSHKQDMNYRLKHNLNFQPKFEDLTL